MSTDIKYNGWTNYETWLVKLWIDNEEPTYNYWNEQARECFENAVIPDYMNGLTWSVEDQATKDLADALKENYESGSYDLLERQNLQASIWADLLNAALGSVNWHEIALSLIETAKESATA